MAGSGDSILASRLVHQNLRGDARSLGDRCEDIVLNRIDSSSILRQNLIFRRMIGGSEVAAIDFAIRVEPTANGTAVVALAGEMDLHREPALAEALQAAAQADKVVVDLREVTFLDSTTLRVLIREHQRRQESGGELLVLVGPQTPMTTFVVTGLDHVLTIRQADPGDDAGPLE
jgi:stage II sporulation protein AA (anti-sigma F factor antagonist)